MQMKREPRGWRDASKAFLSLHGVARELPYLCQRPAGSKSEPRRGLRCIRWGAYGVVGFSGVKDARRASSLPTLQRRLADTALRLHSCCKSPAFLLHKSCTSTAFLNEDHENGTNRRDGSTEAAKQSCKAPGADALDRGEDRRGRPRAPPPNQCADAERR